MDQVTSHISLETAVLDFVYNFMTHMQCLSEVTGDHRLNSPELSRSLTHMLGLMVDTIRRAHGERQALPQTWASSTITHEAEDEQASGIQDSGNRGDVMLNHEKRTGQQNEDESPFQEEQVMHDNDDETASHDRIVSDEGNQQLDIIIVNDDEDIQDLLPLSSNEDSQNTELAEFHDVATEDEPTQNRVHGTEQDDDHEHRGHIHNSKSRCPICTDTLTQQVCALDPCCHMIHQDCLKNLQAHQSRVSLDDIDEDIRRLRAVRCPICKQRATGYTVPREIYVSPLVDMENSDLREMKHDVFHTPLSPRSFWLQHSHDSENEAPASTLPHEDVSSFASTSSHVSSAATVVHEDPSPVAATSHEDVPLVSSNVPLARVSHADATVSHADAVASVASTSGSQMLYTSSRLGNHDYNRFKDEVKQMYIMANQDIYGDTLPKHVRIFLKILSSQSRQLVLVQRNQHRMNLYIDRHLHVNKEKWIKLLIHKMAQTYHAHHTLNGGSSVHEDEIDITTRSHLFLTKHGY